MFLVKAIYTQVKLSCYKPQMFDKLKITNIAKILIFDVIFTV